MTKIFSRLNVDSMIRAMHLLNFCLQTFDRNLIKISWFEIDLFWKYQRFNDDDVDCKHVNDNNSIAINISTIYDLIKKFVNMIFSIFVIEFCWKRFDFRFENDVLILMLNYRTTIRLNFIVKLTKHFFVKFQHLIVTIIWSIYKLFDHSNLLKILFDSNFKINN